jgi:hypothetical protein
MIEQRWFCGAHANVGGSYREDLLPQRPLAWLQQKAISCGLRFRKEVTLDETDYACSPNDSYSEFLRGFWKLFTFGKRYVRWVQSDPVEKKDGWVETVNERIDLSVFERCRRDKNYRPRSLVEWANRKNLDLEDIASSPADHGDLCDPCVAPGIESRILVPNTGRRPVDDSRAHQ